MFPEESSVGTVSFKLSMEISSWIPVSVSDATEVVLKDGEYTKVSFTYTLGYTYDGSNWKQLKGHVSDYVQVTMDAKTVAADYILSGAIAVIDPETMISFNIGTVTVFGKSINVRIGVDVWPITWNSFLKPFILEHT